MRGHNYICHVFFQLRKQYPDMSVELHMTSTQVPKMQISTDGVTLNFGGNINLYATKPGSSSAPFLLTLHAVSNAILSKVLIYMIFYIRIFIRTLCNF